MIPSNVVTSFAQEAQKLGAHPYIHAGLGAAGGVGLGWETLKYINPEQRIDRRMAEMGEMEADLFRRRTTRRAAEVVGAAALGATAGVLSPYLAGAAYKAGKNKVLKTLKAGLNASKSGLGEAAEEAGRRATRGAFEEAGSQVRGAGRGLRSFLGI